MQRACGIFSSAASKRTFWFSSSISFCSSFLNVWSSIRRGSHRKAQNISSPSNKLPPPTVRVRSNSGRALASTSIRPATPAPQQDGRGAKKNRSRKDGAFLHHHLVVVVVDPLPNLILFCFRQFDQFRQAHSMEAPHRAVGKNVLLDRLHSAAP